MKYVPEVCISVIFELSAAKVMKCRNVDNVLQQRKYLYSNSNTGFFPRTSLEQLLNAATQDSRPYNKGARGSVVG
jgi:Glu-tRNA(Gln) amidotransferase subunit E-like FAD-binding protein